MSIGHYVFTNEEISFAKEFCKSQFTNNGLEKAINTINFLDLKNKRMIHHIKNYFVYSISNNITKASHQGILYPLINFNSYSYPMHYKEILKNISAKAYTLYEIAKQANDVYVWLYFLVIAAECDYKINDPRILKYLSTKERIEIFSTMLLIPNFISKIIFAFENANDYKLIGAEVANTLKEIENDLQEGNKEKLYGVIDIAFPYQGKNMWKLFLAGKDKEIASENSFNYKRVTKSSKLIKEKIISSFSYISNSYSFVFPPLIDKGNFDSVLKNSDLFRFLALNLILISKIQTSFSKFLSLKLRKGLKILIGDIIKLCNELKI